MNVKELSELIVERLKWNINRKISSRKFLLAGKIENMNLIHFFSNIIHIKHLTIMRRSWGLTQENLFGKEN